MRSVSSISADFLPVYGLSFAVTGSVQWKERLATDLREGETVADIGDAMLFIPFCASLVLLLFTLFFDLRASRLLRTGAQTEATKAVLMFWPLQVLIHLVVLYVVASTPIIHKRPVTGVRITWRATPGPFIPSFPPVPANWKKNNVEHL